MNFDSAEEIIFGHKSEFESWKTNFELTNRCNYVVARKCNSINGEVIYYNCNRTRKGVLLLFMISQRLLKSQGYCKLDFACTSQIKLICEANQICARVQKKHYGHTFELEHLRISKQDRRIIASKLVSGVTKSRIIDSTRDNIEDVLKRIDLLTNKDIDNIKHSYCIELKDGKRHNNDAISVDLWVKECENMPVDENPILLYKSQGETSDIMNTSDFCLIIMNKFQKNMLQKFGNNIICIDGTHGLNSYEFELTTLVVVDEFGQGFPVAIMFSNRTDTYIYEVFFKNIEKKAGNIKSRTFMSDVTETFYNAWFSVMGPVTHRLFCAWHVDRAWQKNLTKIHNKEKRSQIYKTLKVLQEELNEMEFTTRLRSFLNLLFADKDTQEFGHYFQNNYVNIHKQWGNCYRKTTGINTNMRVESMHKVIKYFYLNLKKIKRLDKGVHIVLKFIRDKSIDRVTKLIKGKNTVYHKEIFKRHESAKTCKFTIRAKDGFSWEIQSKSQMYFVNKILESKCCCLTCSQCNICIHMYSCTCGDFAFKYNICKHIHCIVMQNHQKLTINEACSNRPSSDSIEDNQDFLLLASNNKNKLSNSNLMDRIKKTFVNVLNTDVNSLSDSTICEIHAHLNVLDNLVALPKTSCIERVVQKKNESHNKNITPQKRFFSTHKKKEMPKTVLQTKQTREKKYL